MKSVNGNRPLSVMVVLTLALQTLDEFLPHMIRRLYGLDNADKQKNITNTTCCIQRIQIKSYTSTMYTTYTPAAAS